MIDDEIIMIFLMQRAFDKMINGEPLKFNEKGIERIGSISDVPQYPWTITSVNANYTIDIISNDRTNIRSCDLDWFLW